MAGGRDGRSGRRDYAGARGGVSVQRFARVVLDSVIVRGVSAGLRDGGGNTTLRIGTMPVTRT